MLTVLQLVYLTLHLFKILLLGRLVADYVLMFSRRWQPGRGAAATLEIVWSATDPPLRALRRLIPPLRLGNINLDLGFLLLFLAVTIGESVILRVILSA
ncbi:MAG TPA: YggT family protein [Mycobacteriales bacterium]|nr:YggT family protein [Mycobacteriales bacterium]